MEPVVFPRNVTPVTRTDRVKRGKPREDGRGNSFAKHLHQGTKEQTEGDAAAEEDREKAADEALDVTVPAVSNGASRVSFSVDEAVKKAIDIRV
jgi:hypothetical protein